MTSGVTRKNFRVEGAKSNLPERVITHAEGAHEKFAIYLLLWYTFCSKIIEFV